MTLKKTWVLINSLSGKKNKSSHINETVVNNNTISDPTAIAESFNDYFVNIGLDFHQYWQRISGGSPANIFTFQRRRANVAVTSSKRLKRRRDNVIL